MALACFCLALILSRRNTFFKDFMLQSSFIQKYRLSLEHWHWFMTVQCMETKTFYLRCNIYWMWNQGMCFHSVKRLNELFFWSLRWYSFFAHCFCLRLQKIGFMKCDLLFCFTNESPLAVLTTRIPNVMHCNFVIGF